MSDLVRRQTVALGFELTPDQVAKVANQALYMGGGTAANVSTDWLKSQVVETGRLTGQGGTSLQTIDALKKTAYNNGVDYNDNWFEGAAKDILMGTGTLNGWEKQIKDAAKSKYVTLADQIDAGMNVRDIASPYLKQMAATFELADDTLTLDDPVIQRALTNIDEAGKPSLQPLWKFQQELKKNDRYFQTNAANREMTAVATEIARKFGKAV
jgi:hypothetical protein